MPTKRSSRDLTPISRSISCLAFGGVRDVSHLLGRLLCHKLGILFMVEQVFQLRSIRYFEFDEPAVAVAIVVDELR